MQISKAMHSTLTVLQVKLTGFVWTQYLLHNSPPPQDLYFVPISLLGITLELFPRLYTHHVVCSHTVLCSTERNGYCCFSMNFQSSFYLCFDKP